MTHRWVVLDQRFHKGSVPSRQWLEAAYHREGLTLREIGTMIDRSPSVVWHALEYYGIPRRRRGPQRPTGRRLFSWEVAEIKKRVKNRDRCAIIARDYGVSRQTIYDIARERTWKHV